jgi:predicted DNA binding CopG/RHH family protein
MKKSFRDINPALQFISNTQEVQDVHDTQEVQQVQRTQGKKGQKLPRINMAFQTSNLEYLQIISRIEGKSITEYVNNLVEQDRQKNSERMEAAKQILKG